MVGFTELAPSEIPNWPYNPRDMSEPKLLEYLKLLGDSINKYGQLNVAILRLLPEGKGIEGVVGQCRNEAIKMHPKLKKLKVEIRELTEDECYALAFQSNMEEDKEGGIGGFWRGRKVSDTQTAFKLKEWQDYIVGRIKKENKIKSETDMVNKAKHEIADKIGCNVSWVARLLLIIDKERIHPKVQKAVEKGDISQTAATELARLDKDIQPKVLDKAIKEHLGSKNVSEVVGMINTEQDPEVKDEIISKPLADVKKELKEMMQEEEMTRISQISGAGRGSIDTEMLEAGPVSEVFICECVKCGNKQNIMIHWDLRRIEGLERLEE